MDTVCNDASTTLQRAEELVAGGSWSQCADEYGRAAVLLEKALCHALCKQASALSQLDRHVDALAVAQRAHRVQPTAAEPRYWAALSHERLQKHEVAAGEYAGASELENDLNKRMLYDEAAKRCRATAIQVKSEREERVKAELETLECARTSARMAKQARDKAPIAAAAASSSVGASGVKMDWYQNANWVNVDVMAKNVDKVGSVITFESRKLVMILVRAGMQDWKLEKTLFADVVPEQSRWSVSKYKVEVQLKKANNSKWIALDSEAQVASASVRAGAVAAKRMKDSQEKQRNWAKKAEEELKDYKEDDSAMSVFRQLYESVDEDTRRAMNKSYSESGGQVLSTDWGKVKKERVEYKPVGERDD